VTRPSRISAGSTIAREAGGSLGLGVGGSVLRFLFGVLVARLLALEWLGVYAISYAATRIGVEVAKLGLDHGIVRFVSRLHTLGEFPRLAATLWRGLRYGFLASVIVGMVLWWNADRVGLALTTNSSQAWVLSGFALTIPLMTTAAILAAASQGLQQLRRRTLILDVYPPVTLCLVFVGLSGWVTPKWAIVAAFASAQGVSLLVAVLYQRRSLSLGSATAEAEPGLLSFSIPLMITALVTSLMRFGDVILLGWLTNPEMTGLYQIAGRTSGLIAMATASMMGIFAPIVAGFYARKETEQMRRHLQLVSRWSFTLAWPSFLFFLLFGEQILSVLDTSFAPAAGTLALLGASEVFWSLAAGNSSLLTMTRHPRLNLLIMAIALVIDIAGNLVWIPRYGAAGAALSLMVAVAVWTVLQTLAVGRLFRMVQLSPAHLKPLAAGLVAWTGTLAIRAPISTLGHVLELLAASLAFGGLYVGSLFMLRIDSDDREVLTSLLRRSGNDRREIES